MNVFNDTYGGKKCRQQNTVNYVSKFLFFFAAIKVIPVAESSPKNLFRYGYCFFAYQRKN